MKGNISIIVHLILLLKTSRSVADIISSRVIGGEPAYIGRYPFAAAISVQTSTSRFFCGGTLFENRWIITAGQCVDGAVLFTVRLGSATLENDDPNRITLATSEYFLHPHYNPSTFDNDIGLIKLRMAVEFSDFVRPLAPLALSSLEAGAMVRVIGWGQTSDLIGELSDQLNYANVTVLSNGECRMTYGNQITENMVCVAGNYNEGSCHGDTGSPLIDAYGRYSNIHVGVASFVSSNGCESTDPSGYTRTFPYVDWISNITTH